MFHVNNLDVTQSRQANDSASIAKRAKERFRNCKSGEGAAGSQMPRLSKEFESVNKLVLSA